MIALKDLLIALGAIGITYLIIIITIVLIQKSGILSFLSKFMMGAIILGIVTLASVTGINVDYTDSSEIIKVKKLETVINERNKGEYKVTLSSDDSTVTVSQMTYGKEYRLIKDCKIIKRTILGYKVYTTGDLVVVKPNVKGFDDMSESQKASVVKNMNSFKHKLGLDK